MGDSGDLKNRKRIKATARTLINRLEVIGEDSASSEVQLELGVAPRCSGSVEDMVADMSQNAGGGDNHVTDDMAVGNR